MKSFIFLNSNIFSSGCTYSTCSFTIHKVFLYDLHLENPILQTKLSLLKSSCWIVNIFQSSSKEGKIGNIATWKVGSKLSDNYLPITGRKTQEKKGASSMQRDRDTLSYPKARLK